MLDVVTYEIYSSIRNTFIPVLEVWNDDVLIDIVNLYCYEYKAN